MEKFCHSCKETYPLTPEFWHRNRKKPGGFADECKKCRNKAQEKIRTRGIILKGLGDTTGYIAIKYRKEDLKNVRLKKGQKYRYHTLRGSQTYRLHKWEIAGKFNIPQRWLYSHKCILNGNIKGTFKGGIKCKI